MIDTSSLPETREDRDRWMAEQEARIGRLCRARLRQVVQAAVDAYASTLTAAGDLGALDSIPDAWLTVVQGELVPELGEVYQAGQITAWIGLPEQPTEAFAKQWEAVANENAVSYMAGATNRLAGTGDNVWKDVRNTTQRALSDGLTNEQLKAKIEDVTKFSEYRADTIARTETVGAYVQGDMAGARALGDKGPVEKVWVATLGPRTRDSHAEAHDQVQLFEAPFIVGGVSMDAPHDPSAPAGEVVNCRCYCEQLYVGDQRPDGSTVEPPPGEVVAPPEWTSPAFDQPLTKAATQPPWGSTHHGSTILQTPDGTRYAFKEAPEWRAQGDAAVSELAARAGLDVPRTYVHTLDGQTGTLQLFTPDARPGFPGQPHGFDPTKLSKADISILQDHRAFDWLVGNHNAHAGEFVRDGFASDGAVLRSSGKRQAFAEFGSDRLDYKYHPYGGYGEARSVHSLIEEAYAKNQLPDGTFTLYGNTKKSWAAADKLAAIPDDEYRALLRAYAKGQYKTAAEVDNFLDAAVLRKNNLRTDMARYQSRLYTERNKIRKAEGIVTKPLDGVAGGPKGMTGAVQSKADLAFMQKNDSPLTSRTKAPAAYDYTRSSSTINAAARSGTLDATGISLRAELGTIKTDMVVHRGTYLSGRLPAGGHSGLQGAILHDRAFLSTSAGGKPGFGGDTILQIRVNAGTKASYVEEISAYKGGTEKEVLLDAGQHLYVHKVTKSGSQWIIDAETVSPSWATQAKVKVWDSNAGAWTTP